MQWFGKPYAERDRQLFLTERAEHGPACVFGHAGYLINLAAPTSPNRVNSLKSLMQEVELATSIGLPFLVLHPGAHLGQGEAAGLKQTAAGLDEIFRATRKSRVRIALENTAGQGTCLGHRLEHLAAIYDLVKDAGRLGLCLDTAHLFAAGYDIRKPEGWDGVIDTVRKRIGIREILAFHLNDSKTELGSRVDRHAHIGQGKIGLAGFRRIVSDARFREHPGCLETPKSKDLHEDVENLTTLRSLVGARPRLERLRPRGGTRVSRPKSFRV
jgi:deoxyribonuclease IV